MEYLFRTRYKVFVIFFLYLVASVWSQSSQNINVCKCRVAKALLRIHLV